MLFNPFLDENPACKGKLPWGQTCWNNPGSDGTCDGSISDITNSLNTSMSGIGCQLWLGYPIYAAYPSNLCLMDQTIDPAPWCYINSIVMEACMPPCSRKLEVFILNILGKRKNHESLYSVRQPKQYVLGNWSDQLQC